MVTAEVWHLLPMHHSAEVFHPAGFSPSAFTLSTLILLTNFYSHPSSFLQNVPVENGPLKLPKNLHAPDSTLQSPACPNFKTADLSQDTPDMFAKIFIRFKI
jgi:hypothetical protein